MHCLEALNVGVSFVQDRSRDCTNWHVVMQRQPSQDEALLAIMERDLMDSYHQNGVPTISPQLPQHFVTTLLAVRSLEELMLQWPREIQDKAYLLRGLLSRAGNLIVTYMGKFHLKQLPFGENKLCTKILNVYSEFMVDLTTELEDMAECVKAFHCSFLNAEGQMQHEQILCSCEFALGQAIRVKGSRHMRQLLNFIHRVTLDIVDSPSSSCIDPKSCGLGWPQHSPGHGREVEIGRRTGRSRYYYRSRCNQQRWGSQ